MSSCILGIECFCFVWILKELINESQLVGIDEGSNLWSDKSCIVKFFLGVFTNMDSNHDSKIFLDIFKLDTKLCTFCIVFFFHLINLMLSANIQVPDSSTAHPNVGINVIVFNSVSTSDIIFPYFNRFFFSLFQILLAHKSLKS